MTVIKSRLKVKTGYFLQLRYLPFPLPSSFRTDLYSSLFLFLNPLYVPSPFSYGHLKQHSTPSPPLQSRSSPSKPPRRCSAPDFPEPFQLDRAVSRERLGCGALGLGRRLWFLRWLFAITLFNQYVYKYPTADHLDKSRMWPEKMEGGGTRKGEGKPLVSRCILYSHLPRYSLVFSSVLPPASRAPYSTTPLP